MKYVVLIPGESYVHQVRDAEQVRFVYMLQCESTNRIKVGITDNVESRIGDIQRMSPTKLNLIAVLPSEGNSLEPFLHRRFSKWRIHGEWFEPDDEMIRQIEDMVSGYEKEKIVWRKELE